MPEDLLAQTTPREIRFAGEECKFQRKGVTITGEAALAEGHVIGGPYTSGDDAGKFGVYDPAASDGTEQAYGLLARSIPASTTTDVRAEVYVAGIFRESELGANLDANAKLAMRARSHPDGSIILQGGA